MHEKLKAFVVSWPSAEETQEKFEAYAMAVGKAAHAWNVLHERLGQLFATLSDDRTIALKEWYSRPYIDARQREMLRKLVSGTPKDKWPDGKPVKDDVVWLLDQVDDLAEDRNNAVHTPVSLYLGPEPGASAIRPAFYHGHQRAKNLMGKSLLDEFSWCELCADTLSIFTRKLENGFNFSDRYEWPTRPLIPSRPASASK